MSEKLNMSHTQVTNTGQYDAHICCVYFKDCPLKYIDLDGFLWCPKDCTNRLDIDEEYEVVD